MKKKLLISIFSLNAFLTLGHSNFLPYEGCPYFKIENLNAFIFNKTEIKIEYHWKIVGRINSSYGVVDRFVGDYYSTSSTKPTEDQQITTLLNRYNSHPEYYGSNVRVEKIYSCEFIRKIEY